MVMTPARGGVARLREPMVGELKDILQFKTNAENEDEVGGQTNEFNNLGRVHGRVLPLSAFATFFARQVDSRVTHQITIRYSSFSGTIKRDDRIWMTDRNGPRVFQVDSIRDLENNRKWTEIMAIEQRPAKVAR